MQGMDEWDKAEDWSLWTEGIPQAVKRKWMGENNQHARREHPAFTERSVLKAPARWLANWGNWLDFRPTSRAPKCCAQVHSITLSAPHHHQTNSSIVIPVTCKHIIRGYLAAITYNCYNMPYDGLKCNLCTMGERSGKVSFMHDVIHNMGNDKAAW